MIRRAKEKDLPRVNTLLKQVLTVHADGRPENFHLWKRDLLRKKELNLISWNDAAPKYDIRDWAPEHEKMGKGITLTKEEAKSLLKLLGSEL